MKKQLPKRSEVNVAHTWDINLLFKDEAAYEKSVLTIKEMVDRFVLTYKNITWTDDLINQSLDDMRKIQERVAVTGPYASLQSSGDSTSQENQMRIGAYSIMMQGVSEKLSFYNNTIQRLDDNMLKSAVNKSKEHKLYLEEILKNKKHMLTPEVEQALVVLSPTLNAAYNTYNRFKLVDMKFDDFKVENNVYPNSFTLFENEWEYEKNTKVRRAAYASFYDKLGQYQHGLAANYISHLQKEKALAKLRGFDSTIDYLLHHQEVSRDFMDRQIDVIMEKLAPAMRKYAKLLKDIHGLEHMTYADLKVAVDAEFEPKVTIESAKDYLVEGLSILGPEYLDIVKRSFDERWIDFPQNIGKSTGGFCSSPYGANSFILVNWNGQMDEVMVLAHEIGHAGHFQYANKHQNIFNARPSMYFIEAPSTTNELIMTRHLLKQAKDLRLRRWILSVMISRTYYHNFVTHLLEAAFQREVYTMLDQDKPLSAHVLNQTKLAVIKRFWGDEIVIDDYAGLTWMRQPHYFMGLYPYTYSAGLTIGTVVSSKLFDGSLKHDDWIKVLKTGGTKSPQALAQMVGVDLTTTKPLEDAIDFIADSIEDIIAITKQLKD